MCFLPRSFFQETTFFFSLGWLFYIGTFNSFHNFQSCWNQGSTTPLASRLCVQTLELATRFIFAAPMLMLSVLRHSPTEPPGCLDCMLGSGSAVSCWMFEWFRIQSCQSLGRIGLSILRCLESFASFLHPILGQIWEVPSVGGTRYWLIFGLFWDKSLLDYNWRTIFRLVMKYMDAPLELEMWNEQCCN